MQTIVITQETKGLIPPKAVGAEFLDQAQQTETGTWVLAVTDDTYDRLQGFRVTGESFDGLLTRLFAVKPRYRTA